MKIRGALLFIVLVFLTAGALHAQKRRDNDKLALQFFEKGEFEKANTYFADLFDEQPQAWFSMYYNSLIGARDFSKAEKITKKMLKANPKNSSFYIYLGKIYGLSGDAKREKDAYEKAIKELNPVQPDIENLAFAFKQEKQLDCAISVYNKARKANPDYPYFYERAEIYKEKNEFQNMISEYLDALEFKNSELQTVQMQLQNSLGYDDEKGGIYNPLLRTELQRRIQKHPENEVLAEFLIFILKQQRDFEGAFIQCRALDKRLREDGQRLIELGRICRSNANYELATRCYQYVIDKGSDGSFSDLAALEILGVEYLALTARPAPVPSELLQLEAKLDKGRTLYVRSGFANVIVKQLATLRAYYLNKQAEAITLLSEAIAEVSADATQKADYKLLLGDIYLLSGEIWEASLLYSQVEKSFKFESIGNEAKFRNAKLSYYAGDFLWAKSQCDVLKGSTTKLIANDALDLSLIITDAIGVDTNEAPLKMFSSADLLILQHRYKEAVQRMDSINLLFNSHTLGDDINFKKAAVFEQLGKWTEAEEMYKAILEFYPEDLYGDDALFKLAELYNFKIKDPVKAQKMYEDMLLLYPASIYAVECRKRFRQLRGDAITN